MSGDDDGTPHEDVGDEADGSESTARMLEAKSTEADSRPLLISLPAQLRLDAAVMQDIREGLFSARDTSSRQVSDRVRPAWLSRPMLQTFRCAILLNRSYLSYRVAIVQLLLCQDNVKSLREA